MELKRKKPLEGLTTFIKTAGAYALSRILPRSENRPIILVGGNLGEKYEDNAAAFHEYLVTHFDDTYEIHWMYDPDTDYAERQGIPNAVSLGSFRNYLMFFRAAYTVHGHSLMYDIAPGIDKYIFWNKHTIMVHISHGIECFKKILIMPEDVPLLERADVFNCASRYERGIKRDKWGMPEHKLPVTGMARFDRLPYNSPAKQVKDVLLMMTWRETLMDLTEQEFMASDYFRATEGLLKNEKFQRLLEVHDARLKVVLHPFMKRFENHFRQLGIDSGRMEFRTFGEISIREEIHHSDMLITDYSSIFWDFVYMNRPVVFFTFDQEAFLKMRGSYLDLDTDLLGYKARTAEEAAEAMAAILDGANPENPRFSELPEYVDFTDGKNCERLAHYMFSLKRRQASAVRLPTA